LCRKWLRSTLIAGSYTRKSILVATTKIVDNQGADLQSEASDIFGAVIGEIRVSPTWSQQRKRDKEGNGAQQRQGR